MEPVQELLIGSDNYEIWKACMKTYLKSEGIWDIIKGSTTGDDKNSKKKMNRKALHAIQVSCSPQTLVRIKDITSAKDAWTSLEDWFSVRPLESNKQGKKICFTLPDGT